MVQTHEKIDNAIKSFKHEPAAYYDGVFFTFLELHQRAKLVARFLTSLQKNTDDKVIIFMHRSFDMLSAILGIWQTGAAYVPIDPDSPVTRISDILSNLDHCPIISDPNLLDQIPEENLIQAFTLNDVIQEEISRPNKNLSKTKTKNSLAYIIYTSGSTGKPKGVMVTHNNVYNHLQWLTTTLQLSNRDCFSFNSSLAFDFSVATTLLPLSLGSKIVITREEDTLHINRYCEQLHSTGVTFVKWTPSYFKLILEYAEREKPNLSNLRFVMLAGEELLTCYVKRWFALYPDHTVINEYGPTETTVGITINVITKNTLNKSLATVPIGKPAINTDLYVINKQNNIVSNDQIGELVICGDSVTQGYYKQPKLTQKYFINNPIWPDKQRAYKTGDLVKYLPNGDLVYVGRIDRQLKINGYRVEPTEIESCLLEHPEIEQIAIDTIKDPKGHVIIVGYYVLLKNSELTSEKIRKYLSENLSAFMIPSELHRVEYIPLNRNKKIDYSLLETIRINKLKNPSNDIPKNSDCFTQKLLRIIKKTLNLTHVNPSASFFSLGLTSLLMVNLVSQINNSFDSNIKIQDLFSHSTTEKLIKILKAKKTNPMRKNFTDTREKLEPIAIISMDCRLPGANNCDDLWNLCANGTESIQHFAIKNNEVRKSISKYPVYARGILDNIEYFDADFFKFTPKKARLSDPQHRIMLELAWNTFEKAGYTPNSNAKNNTGIFVSMNDSPYLTNYLSKLTNKDYHNDAAVLRRFMSPQFLATKLAYHLHCQGPCLTLQTACSSALTSVVLACQQLSSYHCDMALAGGISIVMPQKIPYVYQKNNIYSPDGHCRPFDANAQGTVFSNGAGVVLLKRLSDALRDRDTIISVIKGGSINNDGSDKMSYTSPSITGQLNCILNAQKLAGISADTIQYVEAHGTGTLVGDPIEVEALSNAFSGQTQRTQYCALGSLKGNIGHTHIAAGVAGLIKTCLALQNKKIPPSINYEKPNPNINFKYSPFYVNTRLQHWTNNRKEPRRAAVSAFGIGGTNAHLILEEAPERLTPKTSHKEHLLLLSAKNKKALIEYKDRLIEFLLQHQTVKNENILLANMAYTLQIGRQSFDYRTGVVCSSIHDAIEKLRCAGISRASLIKSRLSHQEQENRTQSCIAMLNAWRCGYPIDWSIHHQGNSCYRIPLPTYPFQREYFSINQLKENQASDDSVTEEGATRL